jgi:hypothetical protein
LTGFGVHVTFSAVENLADRAVPGSVRPWREAVRQLIAVAVAVAVIVWGFLFVRRTIENRVPFPPQAMHLRLTATAHTGYSQHLLRRLGVTQDQLTAPLPQTKHDRFVIGRLAYTLPAGATRGQLPLFVIDNRTGTTASEIWGTSSAGCMASGWDGRFNGFADRYPWLRPTAPIGIPGQGYADPGDTIMIPQGRAAPITFIAMFPPETLPFSDLRKDLTVALGFVGDTGHVFWAQRIPIRGTPPLVHPMPPLPTQAELDAAAC